MSALTILRWPDPRLTRPCDPVEAEDLSDLAQQMLRTMYAAAGRGLAGPQVGVMKRIFVMDCGWKEGDPDPVVMINPTIMAADHTPVVADEGCLSIPGLCLPVARPRAVTVQWTDATGQIHMDDFDGFAARCIQHEMDHLAGLVTLDHLDPAARAEAEAQYLAGAA